MTKIFKAIGKNLLVFLAGAVIGIILAIVFVALPAIGKAVADQGPGSALAAVALVPVFVIIYGLFGLAIGGFAGIIIYNIIKFILKRKK